jgi:ankyrin repeat protein
VEVVRALIESGADVDLTTKDGQTAWDLASMNGHHEVLHERLEPHLPCVGALQPSQ